MKILFACQNNLLANPKNNNIAFGAGLNAKFAEEIKNSDVLEISNRLAKKGIATDFKGNKVIAWCSEKTVDIFQQFNEKFGMHLTLPKGIYVEDFEQLNLNNKNLDGFCNLQRTNLKKDSSEIVPAKTIFFNSFETIPNSVQKNDMWQYNWENIDEIADENYKRKLRSTDLFLEPFFQEFSHLLHLENLQAAIGSKATAEKIKLFQNAQEVEKYQKKYGQYTRKICIDALDNPLEAVGCDIPRIISSSLDKNTLEPIKNPFTNTSYEKLSFWKRVNLSEPTNEEEELKEILRNFWNGKFE